MLTDEQICEIGKAAYAVEGNHILPVTFARAIEAEVRKEIEAAVLAEREACAKECDYLANQVYAYHIDPLVTAIGRCIRARTQPMRIDDAHK